MNAPSPVAMKKTMAKARHMTTLPETVMRIIDLVNDADRSVSALVAEVTSDPVLTGRLLKVVNSPFYGCAYEVTSIQRALAMLGPVATKNIAIAVSLEPMFRGPELLPGFAVDVLWRHCRAVGIAAKVTADRIKHPSDEAYLAGLLHDIGLVAELQADRKGLGQALRAKQQVESVSLEELEWKQWKVNHPAVGAELCRRWKLHPRIEHAVAFHHRPLEAPESSVPLACLVHLGDAIASRVVPDAYETVADEIDPRVLEVLQLNPDSYAALEEELTEHLTGE
ncbi:MAG: HDOD domain-containing protein [Myxococcota bacterium]